MKALILAAGEGVRLWPLTADRAKAMLPIGGKPLLEYILKLLQSQGITEIAINLHHQPQAVIDYFGNGDKFGVQITYSIENPILGTAGALGKLRYYFNETFLVVYGDLLTNLNIAPLVEFHKVKKALVTIALHYEENVCASGIVAIDKEGRVGRFLEKPAPEQAFSHLANAGIYVLEPQVIDFIPANSFYDFAYDLFPHLLREGAAIYGFPIADYIIDIGTPAQYRQAKADFTRGLVSFKFK